MLNRRNVARTVVASVLVGVIAIAVRAAEVEFAGVAERMQEFVDEGMISGAVTLVAQEGQVVHEAAVGLANLDDQSPMTRDTLFGIMSMTKPVAATAVMILVDEGKLAVDDPVEKYIPAFADATTTSGEPVRGLTLRHLLTHTSGLTGDQGVQDSLEATAERLAARPFAFQPGAKWEYGPSLNVCGRIVEIVSGQPFEEFLAVRIFRPLEMNNTTFHPTPDERERMAVLYRHDDAGEGLLPTERWRGVGAPGDPPNPSGGLYSTAHDMFRFYQMVLGGGALDGQRILSADAVRQMTSLQSGAHTTGFTPGNAWGLGWCIVREPREVTGMLSPGSYGHGGAYGTQGWVDPVKRRVFVLMIQRAGLPNADGSDIRREFQRLAVEELERD